MIKKFTKELTISAVYFNFLKNKFYIKRFIPIPKSKKVHFIGENKSNYLEIVNSDENFGFKLSFVKGRNKNQRPDEIINPIEFMSIKGVSATGNMLSRYKVKNISLVEIQNSLEGPDNSRNEISNSESEIFEDEEIKKI